MSAYGHAFLHTSNFDRVARHGVLFTNAFTTNPKCAPSRASILTGRHTWQLEEAGSHDESCRARVFRSYAPTTRPRACNSLGHDTVDRTSAIGVH